MEISTQQSFTPVNENSRIRSDGFFGHPKGLLPIGGVELWERLSFYGLQGILAYFIYYSVSHGGLGLDQSTAVGITGSYGAGVYLIQPVGAWIADRVIAPRYVTLLGATVVMTGHVMLALLSGLSGLLVGLALIVIGTGLLTPTVYAMVGALYVDANRTRDRDSGFYLFYGGIQIGAFLGPIVTGYLQTRVGFHAAFSAAAIGMALGIVFLLCGWKLLPASSRVVPNPISRAGRLMVVAAAVFAVLLMSVLVSSSTITLANINHYVLVLVAIVVVLCFANIIRSKEVSNSERQKVVRFIPIFFASVVFELFFLSLFTTLAIYADTRVDLALGSWEVPPSYISSVVVLTGITFSIIISATLKRHGGRRPSAFIVLGIALCGLAMAYALFAIYPLFYGEGNKIGVLPVVLSLALFGVAQITFTPLVMSQASEAAPRSHQASMMAIYSLTMAAGSGLSGFVAQYYSEENETIFFALSACAILVMAIALFAINFSKARANNSASAG